jgi:hypothetical protein
VAGAVRAFVFLGPVLASLLGAWAVNRRLPPPVGPLAQLGHLGLLAAVSLGTLWLADRAMRRLLPLVTLLELTMLFPDQAPSRISVAREAARRRPVEEQLRRVREAGADPAVAAREILGLVAALSAHDRPTRGHAERVRLFTDLVAEQLGLPERERDLLRWAAIIHDIGKLRIPSALLNKPGRPDEAEWAALRSHPQAGADIASLLLPWLGQWGDVVAQHHERWDGTGYPLGLSGRDISLGARIVAVADAYDVMTATRAYRRPVSRAAAYRELVHCSGTQFDPAVVRAMVAVSAPRLRRAQGALAWLGDLPLVATHTVPAATLARVVGAGALATSAVAGAAVASPHPAPVASVAAAAPDGSATATAGPRPGATRVTAGAPAGPRPQVDGQGHPGGSDVVAAATTTRPGAAGTGAASSGPSASAGGSGSAGSGSGSAGSGRVAGTVDEAVGTVGETVGTVGETVGTVGEAVGTVGEAVGTVGEAVGTVGDVVGTATGSVGAAVGGTTGAAVAGAGAAVAGTASGVAATVTGAGVAAGGAAGSSSPAAPVVAGATAAVTGATAAVGGLLGTG